MGFQGLLAKIGIGRRPAEETLAGEKFEDLTVAPREGGRYHHKFIIECGQYVQAIQEAKEGLSSRRLRRAVDALCSKASLLIKCVEQNPDGLSDVRDFPLILKRIHKAIEQLPELDPFEPENERTIREMRKTVLDITDGFTQMERDVLTDSRIKLAALNRSLARLIQNRFGTGEIRGMTEESPLQE